MSDVLQDGRERRSEARYRLGGRVRWSRPDTLARGVGWVVDRSDSSVAFVAAASMQPEMGEEVSVAASGTSGENEHAETMRVRRIGLYGDRLLLVACVAGE